LCRYHYRETEGGSQNNGEDDDSEDEEEHEKTQLVRRRLERLYEDLESAYWPDPESLLRNAGGSGVLAATEDLETRGVARQFEQPHDPDHTEHTQTSSSCTYLRITRENSHMSVDPTEFH